MCALRPQSLQLELTLVQSFPSSPAIDSLMVSNDVRKLLAQSITAIDLSLKGHVGLTGPHPGV